MRRTMAFQDIICEENGIIFRRVVVLTPPRRERWLLIFRNAKRELIPIAKWANQNVVAELTVDIVENGFDHEHLIFPAVLRRQPAWP